MFTYNLYLITTIIHFDTNYMITTAHTLSEVSEILEYLCINNMEPRSYVVCVYSISAFCIPYLLYNTISPIHIIA